MCLCVKIKLSHKNCLPRPKATIWTRDLRLNKCLPLKQLYDPRPISNSSKFHVSIIFSHTHTHVCVCVCVLGPVNFFTHIWLEWCEMIKDLENDGLFLNWKKTMGFCGPKLVKLRAKRLKKTFMKHFWKCAA